MVPDSPASTCAAGRPRGCADAAATARPGEPFRLTLAVLDARANAGVAFEGEIAPRRSAGRRGPAALRSRRPRAAAREAELRAASHGSSACAPRATAGLAAESNPLLVAPGGAALLWADLHGHSDLSDGTGTPEDYFRYARDVAALDVAALTDHDHWGMPFLDERPELWERDRAQTARASTSPAAS